MPSFVPKESPIFVNNDFTITLNSQFIQLNSGDLPLPPPSSKVSVKRYLDGTLHILWNNNELNFTTLNHKPFKQPRLPMKPKSNSPWRSKWTNLTGGTKESVNIFDLNKTNSLLTQKECNFMVVAKESLIHKLGDPKRKGYKYGHQRQTRIPQSNS